MLKILVKKQLGDIFRSYTYDAKKNRARSKEATIGFTVLFVVLMVGVLGGLFTLLSLAMCESMAQVGMSWLYFTIMTLLAAFLGIFGSVFNTYSTLYMAKDNDLLLSLPIPVRTIMAARLVSVYLMGLMYSAVVLLPAIIVYWVVVGITVPVVVGCMIQLLLLSVFVLTLSCALGWVVAKISQKLKNKSFITVLVSLVFIGAYYFFYAKAQSLLTELLANAAYYGASIRSMAYPLYLVGRVAMGNGSAIAIVSAVVLGLFALVWYLIARSFLKLATSTGAVAKVEYREKAARPQSIDRALLGRELSRFTASANYMLNCGMGILGLVIGAAALALVVAALFTVLSALLCLFLGLKMPNLHWTSEITPIKQGGAVALALLSGVVYAALLAAGFFLIGWRIGYMAFMAAFAVVTLAACVLLLRWLKTKGCTVFATL